VQYFVIQHDAEVFFAKLGIIANFLDTVWTYLPLMWQVQK